MKFDATEYGWKPVGPEDSFQYDCSQCGDCCRNVKDCIMLESLDLFRIARHLDQEPSAFVLEYTHVAELVDGVPILLLNTKQHRDACVFLRSGRCSIHDANPRVCRTYPLGIWPEDGEPGGFASAVVSKKPHHFKGPDRIVGDWIDATLTPEDKEFIRLDMKVLEDIRRAFTHISPSHYEETRRLIVTFKYLCYDIGKDFLPQYTGNMEYLLNALWNLR